MFAQPDIAPRRSGLAPAALCLLVTACGGSSADADAAVDADLTDAAPPPPDAAIDSGPPPSRSGVVSLMETTLTNPGLDTIGGPVVVVDWTDNATGTAPVPGYENPIGGCRIVVYDLGGGDTAATSTNEGRVSVTGTEIGDFNCDFVVDKGYSCRTTDSAAAGNIPMEGSSATPGDNDTVTYVISGADFQAGIVDYVGMFVTILGYDEPTANGTFAILSVPSADTLVVRNAALAAPATLSMNGAYYTELGLEPAWAGGIPFLDDGTELVSLSKPDSGAVPDFDVELNANGDGIVLSGTLPHAIPGTGEAITVGCEPCGTTGGGLLNTIVVTGRTTDANLTDLAETAMPDPVTKYAEFRCSAIGATSLELDADAMAAILATLPTRIEMSVMYAASNKIGNTSFDVGHGFTGYTTLAD